MSDQLAGTLRALRTARKAETLRRLWGQVPEWVFSSESGFPWTGTTFDEGQSCFHDLPHSYASLLIAQGRIRKRDQ